MLYLRREAMKIRKDMAKLDRSIKNSEGWQDCAETNEREIRAIRALINEAALAWDDMMQRHFDNLVYAGLTEADEVQPIIPWSEG